MQAIIAISLFIIGLFGMSWAANRKNATVAIICALSMAGGFTLFFVNLS